MKKKYLILGLGKSGISAAKFLLNQNKKIIAFEDNEKNEAIDFLRKKNVYVLTNIENINFDEIEKIIISPGISQNHEIIKKAKKLNIEVIGEIELSCQFLKNKCIAITGTNGKTTLCSLITNILNFCKKKAVSLGNIGNSLSSYLINPNIEDIIVLELSSFQLETMKTKCFDVGIITNISEDHLDRYSSFQEYVNAKLNILNCLKNKSVFYGENKVLKSLPLNRKINIRKISSELEDIALKVCCDLGIEKEKILEAIKGFKSLEHRIEFVKEINGVYFFNDSKATNIYSVIYAIKKINDKKIILIAGGKDKGFDFKVWKKHFFNVKKIIAIGESADKIKSDLNGFLDVMIVKDLKLAVKEAYSRAEKNDAILLSPGCSSYDMFESFEHRGKEFKKLVNCIKGGRCLEEIQ